MRYIMYISVINYDRINYTDTILSSDNISITLMTCNFESYLKKEQMSLH